jgi:hypothetical protein
VEHRGTAWPLRRQGLEARARIISRRRGRCSRSRAAFAPVVFPAGDRMARDGRSVAAGIIFIGSYLALAIGRIPGLNIDRAGIALVGAGLMVASGALPLEDAYKAVDGDTITL